MIEFLKMGGYGFYVWGAYGITAAVLIVEVIAVRRRRRRALEEARLTTPDTLSAATMGVL
jgi:heme exporter protein D